MKTLVIFYSYSGNTLIQAERIAKQESADVIRLRDAKSRSVFATYSAGSFAAMRRKEAKLAGFNTDFSPYDKIVIAMPIWAGHPAPAINNVIACLPEGKEVELIMTSGSGSSAGTAEKTKELIVAKGCRVTSYVDIKV